MKLRVQKVTKMKKRIKGLIFESIGESIKFGYSKKQERQTGRWRIQKVPWREENVNVGLIKKRRESGLTPTM
jgi:hypothetical protein